MGAGVLYELSAEQFDMLDVYAVLALVENGEPITRANWRDFIDRRLSSPTFGAWLRQAGPPPLEPTLLHALIPFEDDDKP
jgi:hypothetical protein